MPDGVTPLSRGGAKNTRRLCQKKNAGAPRTFHAKPAKRLSRNALRNQPYVPGGATVSELK
jgi:hypothetical protein